MRTDTAMIFAQESLTIQSELEPLLVQHYHEIAWNQDRIPLDVDWERYRMIEEMGKFVLFTARVEGQLVGYSAYLIDSHLHYRTTVFAQNDVLYIDPKFRGRQGAKFIAWCEEQLRGLGVNVHGIHIKDSFDWSALARRLGFELMDRIYLKWLG